MAEVTATLVVGFSEPSAISESRGVLSLRIDDRPLGVNGGNTEFTPGQSVGYLLYKSNLVSGIQNFSNIGNIQLVGSGSEQRTETVIFANTDTVTLQFPIAGGIAVSWFGANGGNIKIVDQKDLVLANKFVGVAQITYTTNFDIYQVINMPATVNGLSSFTLVIVATGNVS